MWTRNQLKTHAKAAMYQNYWKCVAAALIVTLIVSGALFTGVQYRFFDPQLDAPTIPSQFRQIQYRIPLEFIIAAVSGIFVFGIIRLAVNIFVFNLFEVGGNKFFVDNAAQPASLKALLCGFEGNSYAKSVLTLFLRKLYIALWSLLLVVPGLVKTYEYRMVPYLLADHPEMSRKEVFAASRQMMSGNKWKAFVLDLSFIGWYLLSALTMGLLQVFYVAPYQNATNAELYLALKNNSGE